MYRVWVSGMGGGDDVPWFGGKCASSKSPWVTAINHHITAKNNHDRTKLNANTINVQRHCESNILIFFIKYFYKEKKIGNFEKITPFERGSNPNEIERTNKRCEYVLQKSNSSSRYSLL